MPRAKSNPLFELGGQWISPDPQSPYLHRFWNDAGTGRTRRQSLGTANLEEAKRKLAEIVVKGAPAGSDTLLSVVLLNYCEQHGDKTATGKQARLAAKQFLECWGDTIKVGAITEERQRRFAEWSIARKHTISYIARKMTVLAAALHRARLPAFIVTGEARIKADWGLKSPKPPKRITIPTDEELARLWRAKMPENLRRWILISMATGCRPAAALDLSPASRIREAGLISLNPEGREQTKKRRPTVRCPAVLTKALDAWDAAGLDAHDGRYVGYASRYSVRQALERVCAGADVNLPQLSLYSFRHKVTTVLRSAGVPGDQISRQLGHSGSESRTTAGYGEWSPGYLKAASEALEAWVQSVQAKAKTNRKSRRNPDSTSGTARKVA